MIENKCSIVRDLLPLFAESMVSDETADFIRAHLAECADCRAALEQLQLTDGDALIPDIPADVAPLKCLRRRLSVRRWQSVLLCGALMLALFFSVFAHLTEPQYFAYSPELFKLQMGENRLFITFSDEVSDYTWYPSYDPETDCLNYWLEAWTTPLDRLLSSVSPRGPLQPSFCLNEDESAVIYYVQNNGAEDVPIYSHNFTPIDEIDWSVITMPRLAMTMYLVAAGAAMLVLGALRWLLRKIRPAARLLNHLLYLSCAFGAALLAVKGFSLQSYSLSRDMTLVLIVCALLFAALELAAALLREYRAAAANSQP